MLGFGLLGRRVMIRTPGHIKRAPRLDLRRPAVLIDSDGVATDVLILDVSSGGFRLEVPEPPRIGEHATLRVSETRGFPFRSAGRSGKRPAAYFSARSIGKSGPDKHAEVQLWPTTVTETRSAGRTASAERAKTGGKAASGARAAARSATGGIRTGGRASAGATEGPGLLQRLALLEDAR